MSVTRKSVWAQILAQPTVMDIYSHTKFHNSEDEIRWHKRTESKRASGRPSITTVYWVTESTDNDYLYIMDVVDIQFWLARYPVVFFTIWFWF